MAPRTPRSRLSSALRSGGERKHRPFFFFFFFVSSSLNIISVMKNDAYPDRLGPNATQVRHKRTHVSRITHHASHVRQIIRHARPRLRSGVGRARAASRPGKKTHISFALTNHHFYHDRLRTNIGKTQKRDAFCLQANCTQYMECASGARKTPFLRCHCIPKTIILARQARDKHRKR
jgi:hypothetical protein